MKKIKTNLIKASEKFQRFFMTEIEPIEKRRSIAKKSALITLAVMALLSLFSTQADAQSLPSSDSSTMYFYTKKLEAERAAVKAAQKPADVTLADVAKLIADQNATYKKLEQQQQELIELNKQQIALTKAQIQLARIPFERELNHQNERWSFLGWGSRKEQPSQIYKNYGLDFE